MAGCNVTLGIHFGTRRSHLATEPTLRIVSNPKKHTLRLIEGNNAARAAHPVDSRIRDFLAGDNDGSELFAAVLRHRSTDTTMHYAKVDVAMLRPIAQPWLGDVPC